MEVSPSNHAEARELPQKPQKKLFIIDAMAMAFRNYHAFGGTPLRTSSGIPTGAVYGSAMFLLRLIEKEKPDFLVLATDTSAPTFRHKLYDGYKKNRNVMPTDMMEQLPYFFAMVDAFRIPILRHDGVEADDLIGSLVTKYASPEVKCFVVSGDKDFLQLVSANAVLYSPKKNDVVQLADPEWVQKEWGCDPQQIIDVLALSGDAVDCVPGVKGIGDKTAIKLIREYSSLKNLYEKLEEIPNPRLREVLGASREDAFLSQKLVTIHCHVDVDLELAEMAYDFSQVLAQGRLREFFKEMEFKTLLQRIAAAPETASVAEESSFQKTSATLLGSEYKIVKTKADFEAFLSHAATVEMFSFDTETTGLSVVDDTPIGFSCSTQVGSGYYVPLWPEHLTEDLTLEDIKAGFRERLFASSQLKIAHNVKFDLQMLRNMGIEVKGPYADTMLCSYVLRSAGAEHGLDACALEHLQFKKIPTTDLMGPKFLTPMWKVPLEQLALYAIEDTDITLRLYHYFICKVQEKNLHSVLTDIDMPLVPILAEMEQTGVYIDADILGELSSKHAVRIKELEEEIHREAGETFNLNSPKQLQYILFEKLKIPEVLGVAKIKKTKTGYSTDVSVLESLDKHPLIKNLLEYRILYKLKNTYIDTLPQLINPKTNRLHTSFHQTGTATGRLSSSDPNLQNIPIRTSYGKNIRQAFCAPSADRVVISADYSQIELRLLAHMSQDESLVAAFRNGEDIHASTASRILDVPMAEVTKTMRSQAKTINFGIIYGMGPSRLARQTNITFSEAKAFIDKYFERYPRIKNFIRDCVEQAKAKGYSTTMLGRIRPIPELTSKDRMVAASAENVAMNSPIQGSAADLMKLAMIAVDRALKRERIDTQMLLQVHDELVFESSKRDLERALVVIKEAMENAMPLSVPLVVEVGHGKDWLEAHG